MKLSPNFRTRVLASEPLYGTWLNLGSPVTAELAGLAGFDWVLLDHEHGTGGEETMLHQLQALASTPAFPVVRIAANEPARFKRALDLGAHGIMVPFVETVAEAQATVSAMRYPPRGRRGIARNQRAAGFGTDFDRYFRQSHESLLNIAQIESAAALAQIEAIAAVEGVDVLFVGPTDLTYDLGIPGEFGHPRFQAALAGVVQAASRHQKAAGILVPQPTLAPVLRDQGFTFLALGSDAGAVQAGLRQSLAALRQEKA